MTDVITEDGSKMETNLPADKVADLQAKPAAAPAEPAAQPAPQTKEEQPQPAPAEAAPAPQEPAQPEPARREKPKPIAKLLEERHTLREENQTLKAKLEELSKQPASAATTDDIKALAEELGADATALQKIVDFARKGMKPELPKEVSDLIAAQKAQNEAQAQEEAYKGEFGRLQNTFKGDEQLNDPKVQDKLRALALSDEKAPDGEEYYKKTLPELYMNYVKPEIEPGTPSAEPSRGGSKAGGKVGDFAEIAADETKLTEFVKTASKEQFKKFHNWQLEHQKEPLKRPGF